MPELQDPNTKETFVCDITAEDVIMFERMIRNEELYVAAGNKIQQGLAKFVHNTLSILLTIPRNKVWIKLALKYKDINLVDELRIDSETRKIYKVERIENDPSTNTKPTTIPGGNSSLH